jgi:hypothetical protein
VLIGVWLWNKKLTVRRFVLALAIPASLLLLFSFYAYSLGDFFAYFAVNQAFLTNIPLLTIPMMALTSGAAGSELYVILFFIYAVGIVQLYLKGYRELFLYALFMFVPVLFVVHNDISRYLLPIAPFALIIGFDALMPKKRRYFLIPLALLCVAGYLYCLAVLPTNLMPLPLFEHLFQVIGVR